MFWLKELGIFGLLVLFLAPIFHPDLLSDPFDRFSLLLSRGNVFHPLLYTLIVYTIIAFIRILFQGIQKLFQKIKTN